MELVVVVAILAIVAGFIVPLGEYYIKDSRAKATNASMVAIRDAIMGTQDKPGFLADTGRLPNNLAELFISPSDVSQWNRDTGLGWHGPYIPMSQAGKYTVNRPAGFLQYAHGVYGPGSNDGYGSAGDLAILDAWGNPIVLQIPQLPNQAYPTPPPALTPTPAYVTTNIQFARLVSAGPNGIIDTPPTATDALGNPYPLPPPATARVDDIVLFINHSDSDP